jgi:FolB domain-containing protein
MCFRALIPAPYNRAVDRILIKDLRTRCIIGVNADERREKQDVTINIVLCTDTRLPGENDRFEDAVDYRAAKKRIIAMVESSQFFLVEALAERIAAICLEDSRVQQAQVTVEKPAALRFARSVGVEITRGRPS